MLDTLFTNGVIAVKETALLGDRILRLCEMTAQEAFRALFEMGFAGGAESELQSGDSERLCVAAERSLDDFIRTYAPSGRELSYLLSSRDFHNAKAYFKAKRTNSELSPLLAPEGLIPLSEIKSAIDEEQPNRLEGALGEAVEEAKKMESPTGAEIGALFDRALFRQWKAVCGRDRVLKKLLAARADMTNLLIAFRSRDIEQAKSEFVEGGKLSFEALSTILDEQASKEWIFRTPYRKFYELLKSAKESGRPFTEAERELDSSEAAFFYERRYDLERKAPFLYYVFRRRAEIANVRIVLVCLNAGSSEREIKERLRFI